MKRPEGLPSIDARTPESKETAKFLTIGIEGLCDTPTEEQQKELDESINRRLKLSREAKKYT